MPPQIKWRIDLHGMGLVYTIYRRQGPLHTNHLQHMLFCFSSKVCSASGVLLLCQNAMQDMVQHPLQQTRVNALQPSIIATQHWRHPGVKDTDATGNAARLPLV